jgi:hypothetical protein
MLVSLAGVGFSMKIFRDCDWSMNGPRSALISMMLFCGISQTVR